MALPVHIAAAVHDWKADSSPLPQAAGWRRWSWPWCRPSATLIYLSSVWDPASHTQVPAVGFSEPGPPARSTRGRTLIGQEVIWRRLRQRHTSGFVDLDDENHSTRTGAARGVGFALIIPPDFSSNVAPGAQLRRAGRLVVYTSEGNNYQSVFLARRFADDPPYAVMTASTNGAGIW